MPYTRCPIDMLTSSDSILQILKPHIPKGKTCFEILVKKAFRWHLETWENQIGSIFKLNIKKSVKFQKQFGSKPLPLRNIKMAPYFCPL